MRNEPIHSKLKSHLSLFDATAISIGAIIGAGIFVVTGIAAGFAGSALAVSMLIAAIISLFTALSFVELTTWRPMEGGIYEYAYRLVSPFTGFLSGWMWMLSNIFTGAAVSLGFAYYFTAMFPVLPANLLAAAFCISFSALNFIGTRQSALANNFMVVAKLLILMFFVILGVASLNMANFNHFAPLNIGVFYGAAYIFFAYGGFARVAVIAEEIKDAKRNVPRAILLSLAVSTVIYILVGIVAIGLAGAHGLASSNSPLTTAISVTGSSAAIYIVSVGGLLATASVLLTTILGVSRMAYAMARRKDMPQILTKLHPTFETPYYSIWATGILMAVLVLSIDLSKVVAISVFSLLFYYALANISAFRLKTKKRMYTKSIPILGMASCLALLVFIFFVSPQAWVIGAAGLIVGTIYYVAKRIRQES